MTFRETIVNDMPGHKMLSRFVTDKKLDLMDARQSVLHAFVDWTSKHGFGTVRTKPGYTNVSNKLPVVDKLTDLVSVRVSDSDGSTVLSVEIVGTIATKELMGEISTFLKNVLLKNGGGKKRRATRKRRVTKNGLKKTTKT